MTGQLRERHGAALLSVACLQYLGDHLLTAYAENHARDPGALVGLLEECTAAWCEKNDVPVAAFSAAVLGLRRAGETASILARMPN